MPSWHSMPIPALVTAADARARSERRTLRTVLPLYLDVAYAASHCYLPPPSASRGMAHRRTQVFCHHALHTLLPWTCLQPGVSWLRYAA